MMANQSEKPNFHSVARQRVALRRAIREAKTAKLPESLTNKIEQDKAALDATAKEFPYRGKSRDWRSAKKFLSAERTVAEKEKAIDQKALRAEIGPSYDAFNVYGSGLTAVTDFQMRRLRESANDPYAAKVHESMFAPVRESHDAAVAALDQLRKTEPRAFRASELASYRASLFEGGHIVRVPSTEAYEQQIGQALIHGKPIFLHGPTGTGKTTLATDAAHRFTGTSPEVVYCSPQMRESQIWGKTGIKASGEKGAIETVDIYGPLARSIRDGTICVFDEFTALRQEDQVFIKGLFNKKPGDIVQIPGHGEQPIVIGFDLMFTANLKSDKHPDRQKLVNEMAREFRSNNIRVMYTPRHEAYDIMLARLMGPDGSVQMSWHDLNETLPKLCQALEEIQLAYTGALPIDVARLLGVADAGGRTPGLKDFVLTQGTIEDILGAWNSEMRRNPKISFVELLESRLKINLTFDSDPESDRTLAAIIIAHKGLLPTLSSADLGLPNGTIEPFGGAALREFIDKSKNTQRIGIMELADLDPFNVRKASATATAQGFQGPKPVATATSAPDAQPDSATTVPPTSAAPSARIPSSVSSPQTPDHAEVAFRNSIANAQTSSQLDAIGADIASRSFPRSVRDGLQQAVWNRYDTIFKHNISTAHSSSQLDSIGSVIASTSLPSSVRNGIYQEIWNRYDTIFKHNISNAHSSSQLESIEAIIASTSLPRSVRNGLQQAVWNRYDTIFKHNISTAHSSSQLDSIEAVIASTSLPRSVRGGLNDAIRSRRRTLQR